MNEVMLRKSSVQRFWSRLSFDILPITNSTTDNAGAVTYHPLVAYRT